MTFQSHPLTPDRFADFADVVNPNRRATHCWCLSHRLQAKDIEELGTGNREQAMRRRRLRKLIIPSIEKIDVRGWAIWLTVMAGLGPAIHDCAVKHKERRGWPAQGRP